MLREVIVYAVSDPRLLNYLLTLYQFLQTIVSS